MLPLKTLLYLGLFGIAVLGAIFYHPIVGIYAYLGTYNINPLGHWWGSYLPDWASRYSMIIVIVTTFGVLLHLGKLRLVTLVERQEILLLIFLGIIWLSVLWGQGWEINYNVYKMGKVVLVLLIASHVITTLRFYEGMLWVLIIAGLYLGFEMYSGAGIYRGGRFDVGVGGSDFSEGNFLAAHFAFLLPLAGIMFLKGSWKARFLGLVSVVFMLNSIVLTRSRGAFLALAIGMVAAFIFSAKLRVHKKKVVVLMMLGVAGVMYLTDPGFWGRMETIQVGGENLVQTRDTSAANRLIAWRGAWAMVQDYPLGVGVGSFFDFIGQYEPSIPGKDTHNTYFRCLAELGFVGFFVLMLLIVNAFWMLFSLDKSARSLSEDRRHAYHLHVFGVAIALVVYLSATMFISSTYIEEFYWLLMMPVFLKRALDNEMEEAGMPEVRNL
ncbi:MAG: O-antigen ligase family protein [Desulfurivibrionaceae bacterium]